jgi:multisubunit Na+/H+ antiporter MnhC subunit
MILGRSTVQWVSLLTAAGGFAQVVGTLLGLDAELLATVIGAAITFSGAFLAFLAQTQTTPTSDPILPPGTTGRIEGTEDTFTI